MYRTFYDPRPKPYTSHGSLILPYRKRPNSQRSVRTVLINITVYLACVLKQQNASCRLSLISIPPNKRILGLSFRISKVVYKTYASILLTSNKVRLPQMGEYDLLTSAHDIGWFGRHVQCDHNFENLEDCNDWRV